MPYYRWVGIDFQGQIKKGTTFAQSPSLLEQLLVKQEIGLMNFRQQEALFKNRWRAHDAFHFFKQLSVLLGSGVFVTEALSILVEQAPHEHARCLIKQLNDDVHNGIALSVALEKCPDQFNALMVTMVRAGEESGQLEQTLESLCLYLEYIQLFYQRLRAALLVPAITFLFFIGIAITIITVIVPKVAVIFQDSQQPLPTTTACIITLSVWCQFYWPFILFLIGILFFAIRHFFSSEKGRVYRDRIIVTIPWLSGVMINQSLVYCLQAFAILLQAGLPLVKALDIAHKSIVLMPMKQQVKTVIQGVEAGQSLSQTLKAQPELFFPSDVVTMIRVGEESGRLGFMVDRCAKLYETKVNTMLSLGTTLIQPLLMIVLGLLIAALIVAVYMPIMELSNIIPFA